jgi:hypothetical protein
MSEVNLENVTHSTADFNVDRAYGVFEWFAKEEADAVTIADVEDRRVQLTDLAGNTVYGYRLRVGHRVIEEGEFETKKKRGRRRTK